MQACRLVLLMSLLPCMAPAAWAQAAASGENVRMDWAQVLRAEPVYQTLRATSMVERCEQSTPVQADAAPRRGIARVVGAVRDVLTPSAASDDVGLPSTPARECRMVPVEREFRRPIAFDVDYIHKGVRYRSRMPYDPGNRLRVRVAVTPVIQAGNADR